MVRAEKQFINKYYKDKRLYWRNYFGPEGPRPPPFLSMWPAERVGDIHQVVTAQNYWYVYVYLCISMSS
jgi:beta-galactosidase GanA